jgi:hypothetical protein
MQCVNFETFSSINITMLIKYYSDIVALYFGNTIFVA